jgi:RNA polymerase sigma factor for flagellar operon FliA
VEDTMAQLQAVQFLNLDDFLPSEDRSEGRRIDVISGEGDSPLDSALQKEKEDLLVRAILELPDQQQKVLNLYYYEELTLKEIGAVLEVSESRICQIHGAAVKQLRKVVRGEA